MEWFKKQSKLVKFLLLLIPVVNWITEIVVRWGSFSKKGGIIRLIIALVVTFIGVGYAWIDAVWVLLFDKLLLE